MLDGLNEVRADYRKQIVNAIRILSLNILGTRWW